jgi:hypothetical protein
LSCKAKNTICLNGYYYTLEVEIFEGKMKGKNFTFCKFKVLDLSNDEAQYFLDVTGQELFQVMAHPLAR